MFVPHSIDPKINQKVIEQNLNLKEFLFKVQIWCGWNKKRVGMQKSGSQKLYRNHCIVLQYFLLFSFLSLGKMHKIYDLRSIHTQMTLIIFGKNVEAKIDVN
jgi:hypothetical protein